MRYIVLAAVLFLSACTPDTVPPPQAPLPPQQSTQVVNDITGFTAPDLIRRFGSPAFQVREGTGLKMQWRGIACVLDAYLYPAAGNVDRVLHVDTRLASGNEASQAACIAALEAR
jgi:hypothetical protein